MFVCVLLYIKTTNEQCKTSGSGRRSFTRSLTKYVFDSVFLMTRGRKGRVFGRVRVQIVSPSGHKPAPRRVLKQIRWMNCLQCSPARPKFVQNLSP